LERGQLVEFISSVRSETICSIWNSSYFCTAGVGVLIIL